MQLADAGVQLGSVIFGETRAKGVDGDDEGSSVSLKLVVWCGICRWSGGSESGMVVVWMWWWCGCGAEEVFERMDFVVSGFVEQWRSCAFIEGLVLMCKQT